MKLFKTHFFLISLTLWVLTSAIAFAQNDHKKKVLDSLILQVDQELAQEKWQDAHNTLVSIFNLNTVLPDEVAYFYGKTLFHLEKYPSSKSALKKYLELTDHKGEFYQEAYDLIYKTECKETGMANVEEACHICDGSGNAKTSCRTCKGSGKIICTSCRGTGVYQSTDNFGTRYDTCHKCSGKGIVNCISCNGNKEINSQCHYCSATGKIKLKVPCK